MMEDAIESVLLLKGQVTIELLETMLSELHRKFHNLKSALPIRALAELAFHQNRFYDKYRPESFKNLVYDDDILLWFDNMETKKKESWFPPDTFKNHVRLMIGSLQHKGPFSYAIEDPSWAWTIVELYCAICHELNPYLGLVAPVGNFFPKEYDVKKDTMYKSNLIMEYYQEILSNKYVEWQTFFFDIELAESIGVESLKNWGATFRELPNLGFFVSRMDVPIVRGKESDDEIARSKDEFYNYVIRPKLLERIHQETERVEGPLV